MKPFIKILSALAIVASSLVACDKVEDLPHYENGSAPVLTASSATVAPAPADSNNTALTLNWTYPDYATDTANIKYIVEIDSTGKNFSKASSKQIVGSLSTSFLAKELNTILLGFGYVFNKPVDMDVKVTSSYVNNNEKLASNIVKIRMTPYKIPPKVELPTSGKLFIVGSATQIGWTNPVPVPTQELTRIDETTFGGIFQLNAASEYLLLPENGNWDKKYAVTDNTVPGLNEGGSFGYGFPQNFPGPSAAGWYKIIVDFQTGKFTVTPFTQQHGLPSELFIVGNATVGDWTNPVPVPSQQFTRINSTRFEIASLAMAGAGKEYLLLPENGNWGKKFGVADNTVANIKLGGTFVPEGQNLPSPDAGNYKIVVDFVNNSYTLTKL